MVVAFCLVACANEDMTLKDSSVVDSKKQLPQTRIKNSLVSTIDDSRITEADCVMNTELKKLFERHNHVRLNGANCGRKRARKTHALHYNCFLAEASWRHAYDMDEKNYLSHDSRNGFSAGKRATESGYSWVRIAENIARGFKTTEIAQQTWMASAPHCQNIMNPNFTEMGAAIVGEHWVVMFGSQN